MMIVIATACNLAMLVLAAIFFHDLGLPTQKTDMVAASLMVIAPITSLWVMWQTQGRGVSNWIALELKARRTVLDRRLRQHSED